MPRIIRLRKERLRLKNEMQSLAGTVQAAAGLYPELYQKHDEVCKKLTRVRKALRDEVKKGVEEEEEYDIVPKIKVDKQVDQLLDKQNQDLSNAEGADEAWNPAIPQYEFPERARIVETFHGPEPETLENELALARRIQVTKDLTALYGFSEPSCRGKRCNWTGMATAMMNPSK